MTALLLEAVSDTIGDSGRTVLMPSPQSSSHLLSLPGRDAVLQLPDWSQMC